MFQKILIILNKIHQVGIIHRDLKPQNILIKHNKSSDKVDLSLDSFNNNYQLYVIDFGLARMIRMPNKQVFVSTQSGGFAGTVNYASIRAHLGEN